GVAQAEGVVGVECQRLRARAVAVVYGCRPGTISPRVGEGTGAGESYVRKDAGISTGVDRGDDVGDGDDRSVGTDAAVLVGDGDRRRIGAVIRQGEAEVLGRAVAHYLAVAADHVPVVGEGIEGPRVGNRAAERDHAPLVGRLVAARADRGRDVI